jgi:hypothetical protein
MENLLKTWSCIDLGWFDHAGAGNSVFVMWQPKEINGVFTVSASKPFSKHFLLWHMY